MITESTATDDEAHSQGAPWGVLNYIKTKIENHRREILIAGFISEIEDIRTILKNLINELKVTKENRDNFDKKDFEKCCAHLNAKIAASNRHLMKMCEIFQVFFGHHPYDKEIQANLDDGF